MIPNGTYICCSCGQHLLTCVSGVSGTEGIRDLPSFFEYTDGTPVRGTDEVIQPCPACSRRVNILSLIRSYLSTNTNRESIVSTVMRKFEEAGPTTFRKEE